MAKKRFLVVFGVVSLLLMLLTLADTDTAWSCRSDSECEQELRGRSYYCNSQTGTCFLKGDSSPSSPGQVRSRIPDVLSLNERVDRLERQLDSLLQEVRKLQEDFGDFQRRPSTRTFTGQAQQLPSSERESDTPVQNESSLFKPVIFVFIALLFLGMALFFFYQKKVSPQEKKVLDYITAHIRQGKKFSHIKESLQKVGWAEQEIIRFYKKAATANYQQYKERFAGKSKGEKNAPWTEQKKVFLILGITLLLVGGIFFLLQRTVGEAISTERLVGGEKEGYAGEVTYVVSCTAPQIPTPEGTSCCTDLNQNEICDVDERQVDAARGRCTDNLQCAQGEYCIDGRCASFSQIYKGSSSCEKLCNFYSMKISTSDGESYYLKPGEGSYTAVGALQWDIMKGVPVHCEGEAARVPILITKKKTGGILSEEVITLKESEISKVLEHELAPQLAFTLTMGRIYELCEENSGGYVPEREVVAKRTELIPLERAATSGRENEAITTPLSNTARICSPRWVCSDWSKCANGKETRSCSDDQKCNVNTGKPNLERVCAEVPAKELVAVPSQQGKPTEERTVALAEPASETKETTALPLIMVLLIIIAGGVAYLLQQKLKNK